MTQAPKPVTIIYQYSRGRIVNRTLHGGDIRAYVVDYPHMPEFDTIDLNPGLVRFTVMNQQGAS